MKITALKNRPGIEANKKLSNLFSQFGELLKELRQKNLPTPMLETLNREIRYLNTLDNSTPNLRMEVTKIQTRLIRLLEKEIKLVPKNYYRNIWLTLGMGAFGLPIGVALGALLQNMGLLGIGLPIGMGIGIAFGLSKDKKAFEEGRQLDIALKY